MVTFLICTGVDTSLPALELANENIKINDLDPGRISFLRCDATEFMKDAVSRNESWDIVIMDPPKLAPRKKVCTMCLVSNIDYNIAVEFATYLC